MPFINQEAFEEVRRHQEVTKYEIYPLHSVDIEDYQVLVEDVPSLISEDIRIIHNRVKIPFWQEEKGKVWSKIANLKTKTPQQLFALSGNSSPSSDSSGSTTFDFFNDYDDFTEIDPNAHLTIVGTDHLDFDAYTNEDCYLYKDYGVDYFGDFEHKVDARVITANEGQEGFFWQLSNDIDDFKGLIDADKTALGLCFSYGAATHRINLIEEHSGLTYSNNYICALNTWYYFTITKSGTSLTCKIYSDSARTTLLDTLSLTLHADHKFRYLFGCNTYNSGAAQTCTLDIENLNGRKYTLPEPLILQRQISGKADAIRAVAVQ